MIQSSPSSSSLLHRHIRNFSLWSQRSVDFYSSSPVQTQNCFSLFRSLPHFHKNAEWNLFSPARGAYWKKKPVIPTESGPATKCFQSYTIGDPFHLQTIALQGTDYQEISKLIKLPAHLDWGKPHNSDFYENLW